MDGPLVRIHARRNGFKVGWELLLESNEGHKKVGNYYNAHFSTILPQKTRLRKAPFVNVNPYSPHMFRQAWHFVDELINPID